MDRDAALSQIDRAVARYEALRSSLGPALDDVRDAVRVGHHVAGIPQAELAARYSRHRNTIALWCRKASEK